MTIQGTPAIDLGPERENEARDGIGDLPAHQNGREARADLHHRQRHDEGRNADAGDAEGGDEAERATGRKRKDDRDRSRQREVGDVHVVRLQREKGQDDRGCVGDRADAEIDFGGQNDEGQADGDDRGDRDLLQNVLQIAERRKGRSGDAEEDDEAKKRDERRDIAQLVAQEIPGPKGAGRGRIGAWRVHQSRDPRRQAAANRRSLLIASPANSCAISPLRITRTRSASERTVSGSVEKTTIAMP